jgi:protein SCO1/2
MGRWWVRVLVSSWLAALSGLGGCAWLLEDPVRAAEKPAPRRGRASLFSHPWSWTDDGGKPVEFARWRGREVVVATFFSTCRETCPRVLRKMREVHADLGREGRDPQVVLVTLDPAVDRPERLRQFRKTEKLPASWRLLAGSPQHTRELAEFLDIHVMNVDAHTMHDGRIVVFDTSGMATVAFTGWDLGKRVPAR